jgi:hypothetical protein
MNDEFDWNIKFVSFAWQVAFREFKAVLNTFATSDKLWQAVKSKLLNTSAPALSIFTDIEPSLILVKFE